MGTTSTQSQIFRYVIASGEMRFIERDERWVHLSEREPTGLAVWGEIPECGEACHADLGLLLLEHSMSCEGCQSPEERKDADHAFGDSVAGALADRIARLHPKADPDARARSAIRVLVNSIRSEAPAQITPSGGASFADCPLCATARANGVVRDLEQVHRAFYDLVDKIIAAVGAFMYLHRGEFSPESDHPLQFELKAGGT